MPTARQIATWIVRYRAETGAPIDPMSLQKLLFYVQAFHLARHGEALFADRFKAWRHGPVVPSAWKAFEANQAGVILPRDDDPAAQLDEETESSVRDTVQFFGRLTAFQLSDATHQEDPWRQARGNRAWHEESDQPIQEQAIRTYYAGLIADGEDALSRHEVLDVVPEPRVGCYYQAGICVRRMKRHPLYSLDWAEALLRPVPADAKLSKRLFAPMKRREFVPVSDL